MTCNNYSLAPGLRRLGNDEEPRRVQVLDEGDVALIDADIVAFRCAASANSDIEKIAFSYVRDLIDRILDEVGSLDYKLYLSGDGNFRKIIYPSYKANRADKIPPMHLDACKEYIKKRYHGKVFVSSGEEADDMLGYNQTEKTVICSIDKDLLMIPGKHYNFVKEIFSEVSEDDALKQFYRLLLIGDNADNIKGVYGIGPKKASALIDGLTEESEMFEVVRDYYKDDTRLLLNCNLFWVRRKEKEYWTLLKEKMLTGFNLFGLGLGVLSGLDETSVQERLKENISLETDGFLQHGTVTGAIQ